MRWLGNPCRYFTPKEDGKFTALWFYVVPLDEHSTRVINHAVIVQPLPKLVKMLAAARPRWIDHLLLNEIFDGDMAYLAKACVFSEASSEPGMRCPFMCPGLLGGTFPGCKGASCGTTLVLLSSGQCLHH